MFGLLVLRLRGAVRASALGHARPHRTALLRRQRGQMMLECEVNGPDLLAERMERLRRPATLLPIHLDGVSAEVDTLEAGPLVLLLIVLVLTCRAVICARSCGSRSGSTLGLELPLLLLRSRRRLLSGGRGLRQVDHPQVEVAIGILDQVEQLLQRRLEAGDVPHLQAIRMIAQWGDELEDGPGRG